MRLAHLPALLFCLPACIVIDGGGDDTAYQPTPVVAAGSSYGECLGRCDADLAIVGEELSLTFTSNNSEIPDLVNTGALTAAAIDDLDDLAQALAGEVLLDTYGCPDCDDGGAAHLDRVVGGDAVARSTWEHGNPPPVLAGAAALLFDDLIAALTDCAATARVTLVSCSPPY
jgi:hypothetical protein